MFESRRVNLARHSYSSLDKRASRNHFFPFCVIACGIVACGTGFAFAQLTNVDLITSITNAYSAFERKSKSIQGSYSGHNEQAQKGTVVRTIDWTVHIKQSVSGGSIEDRFTTVEGDKNRAVYKAVGRNSKYAFALKKNRTDEWLLSEIQPQTQGGLSSLAQTVDKELLKHVSRHYQFLDDEPLVKVIRAPGFKILQIGKTQIDTRSAVDVDFQYDPKVKEDPGTYKGTITLDAEFWCVRNIEAEFIEPGGGRRKYRAEYAIDTTGAGKGGLRKMKSKLDYSSDYRAVETTFDFHYDETLPESAFSLSAFGLPEPMGVAWPRRTRWYAWFGLGGAVLIGLGLYLRRRLHGRANWVP